jgi:hypothetical protein
MGTTAYRPSTSSSAFEYDHATEYDYATTDPQAMPYGLARAEQVEPSQHDPIPLFLSDPEGQPDPGEFALPAARTRGIAAQLVAGVLAAGAIAVLITLFHSDVSRLFVANAKALMSGATADQPVSSPPTVARQVPVKDPARVSGPMQLASADAKEAVAPVTPSREAIATAYQSALQAQTPAPAPVVASPVVASPAPAAAPAPAAPPAPVKTLDADTLAGLMTRAKSLMAVGDLAAARLLLERAANAQDANAAFILAQTYDPVVLGTQDTRSITADPAAARSWYQKAAQLGSADARQRLSQLQN